MRSNTRKTSGGTSGTIRDASGTMLDSDARHDDHGFIPVEDRTHYALQVRTRQKHAAMTAGDTVIPYCEGCRTPTGAKKLSTAELLVCGHSLGYYCPGCLKERKEAWQNAANNWEQEEVLEDIHDQRQD